MERLLAKQYLITGYLEFLIDNLVSQSGKGTRAVEMITPRDPRQRGTQLSLIFPFPLKEVHERLEKRGVVVSDIVVYIPSGGLTCSDLSSVISACQV